MKILLLADIHSNWPALAAIASGRLMMNGLALMCVGRALATVPPTELPSMSRVAPPQVSSWPP